MRVCALGQRWRRVADHVATTAGAANGQRVRRWVQDKKAGWYTVLTAPRMPVTSTWLDQAHNAIERKLFAMKGFHHPGGNQQAFVTGLAHLYNLVPYQRRAQHAGQSSPYLSLGACLHTPPPSCKARQARHHRIPGPNERQPPHFSTPITPTSTRRFFARPSSVLLSAIGLASPAPLTCNFLGSAPRLIRASRTASARCSDSVAL